MPLFVRILERLCAKLPYLPSKRLPATIRLSKASCWFQDVYIIRQKSLRFVDRILSCTCCALENLHLWGLIFSRLDDAATSVRSTAILAAGRICDPQDQVQGVMSKPKRSFHFFCGRNQRPLTDLERQSFGSWHPSWKLLIRVARSESLATTTARLLTSLNHLNGSRSGSKLHSTPLNSRMCAINSKDFQGDPTPFQISKTIGSIGEHIS